MSPGAGGAGLPQSGIGRQTATLDPDTGVYHGTDTWTVIGGTGRFNGATGSGTGETTADLASSTFTKAFTGSITY